MPPSFSSSFNFLPGLLHVSSSVNPSSRLSNESIPVHHSIADLYRNLTISPAWLDKEMAKLEPAQRDVMWSVIAAFEKGGEVGSVHCGAVGGSFTFDRHHVSYERHVETCQIRHILVIDEHANPVAELGQARFKPYLPSSSEEPAHSGIRRQPNVLQIHVARAQRGSAAKQLHLALAEVGISERDFHVIASRFIESVFSCPEALSAYEKACAAAGTDKNRLLQDAYTMQHGVLTILGEFALACGKLKFTPDQLISIGRRYPRDRAIPIESKSDVDALRKNLRTALTHITHLRESRYTPTQIAEFPDFHALEAVYAYHSSLEERRYTKEDIATFARRGGADLVETVRECHADLAAYGYSADAVTLVAVAYGADAVRTVRACHPKLEAYRYTTDDVTEFALTGGSDLVEAVRDHHPVLAEHEFIKKHILEVVARIRALQPRSSTVQDALRTIALHLPDLKELGYNPAQIAEFGASTPTVEAVCRYTDFLKIRRGMDISDIAKIAMHADGATALGMVAALEPDDFSDPRGELGEDELLWLVCRDQGWKNLEWYLDNHASWLGHGLATEIILKAAVLRPTKRDDFLFEQVRMITPDRKWHEPVRLAVE